MHIDIWSDVVCPWCYIGKRRLEAALQQVRTSQPVSLRYRSFQLDPEAPVSDSRTQTEILAQKYGLDEAEVLDMQNNVALEASKEGLEFRLDIAKPSNSFDAHQLLHLAGKLGLQPELKERFMAAHFSEGRVIGDHNTLVELATEVGIDADLARRTLVDQTFSSAVRHDQQLAAQLGVRGVPFFVIDMKYGISGAQPVSHFVEMIQNLEKDLGEMA